MDHKQARAALVSRFDVVTPAGEVVKIDRLHRFADPTTPLYGKGLCAQVNGPKSYAVWFPISELTEKCRDVKGCDKPAVGVLVGIGRFSGRRLVGRVPRCQAHLDSVADKVLRCRIASSVGQTDAETAEKLREVSK